MNCRLSTVRSSFRIIIAMCFTSVSSAYPNAINSTSGGKNMKNNVIGSRQTMINSLNRIAPRPRKGTCFISGRFLLFVRVLFGQSDKDILQRRTDLVDLRLVDADFAQF